MAWLIALIAVGRRHRLHPDRDAGVGALDLGRDRLRRRAPGGAGAGGATAGDHPGARGRRERSGAPRSGREAAERCRDAWLDERHLHGQDRDADREPDECHVHLDAVGLVSVWRRETRGPKAAADPAQVRGLATAMVACNNAHLDAGTGKLVGDPTEVAIMEAAGHVGVLVDAAERERGRRALFHFDPSLRLMSTVDQRAGGLWVDTKGAPEAVLPRCSSIAANGAARQLDAGERERVQSVVDEYASQGLRVLAIAERGLARQRRAPEAGGGRDGAHLPRAGGDARSSATGGCRRR